MLVCWFGLLVISPLYQFCMYRVDILRAMRDILLDSSRGWITSGEGSRVCRIYVEYVIRPCSETTLKQCNVIFKGFSASDCLFSQAPQGALVS